MLRQPLNHQPISERRPPSVIWRAFTWISLLSAVLALLSAIAQHERWGVLIYAGLVAGTAKQPAYNFVDYGFAAGKYYITFDLIALGGGFLFAVWLLLLAGRWLLRADARRRGRAA